VLSCSMHAKARSIDSVYCIEFNLPYAHSLCGAGRFADAQKVVDDFLAQPNLKESALRLGAGWKKRLAFANDYQQKHAGDNYVFAPLNMGDSVNSVHSEYFPSVSIDGNELVFTRRLNNFNEDFFVTHKNKNQIWTKSIPLPGAINTDENEGAQCVSQDGEWLIFTGCNNPTGFGSCDLWISYKTNNGWSEPENLGPNINTEFWESAPSLSPDKRDLYFSSRRTNGNGAADIYVSHRLPNGKWTVAENLGTNINTRGEESCPYIHADNQTMYLLSDGLQGYGGTDLFVVRKQKDGTWGTPQNLGYPINTIDNEGSIIVAADGQTAYYASDRSDTRGGLDLYSFTMREESRPRKTFYVKGKVFDSKTNKGLPSNVQLIDMDNNQALMNVQTDEVGQYFITLPTGTNYTFAVNRKGYLFYSEVYALAKNNFDSVYEKNIPLNPIELKSKLVLKNILFENKKFDLLPLSMVELDRLVQLLTDNPTVKILIKGYTDNVGKPTDNLKLSMSRAKAVVTYLVSKGIGANRLTAKGFGQTGFIADNKIEEGRAKNRRTEFEVVQM
jgi:outer membrane protein OmpA-like peptidoglycan-associated protein